MGGGTVSDLAQWKFTPALESGIGAGQSSEGELVLPKRERAQLRDDQRLADWPKL